MSELQAEVAAGQVASIESEVVEQTTSPGAADTPETVEETDEQKNARVIQEREERSRKRAESIQKRINELTADKYTERQRAERLERQLEELSKQQRAAQQPKAGDDDPRPKRDAFDDYDEYQVALGRWAARQESRQIAQAERQRWQAEQQQASAHQQVARIAQEHGKRLQAYAKANPDFAEVTKNEAVVNDAAAVLLATLPNGPALIHALHRSPELVDQLNDTPPHLMGVVLGEISASLKNRPPQVSQAPAPGTPVGGKAAPAKSLADMDYDEYVRTRRKQRS